MPNAPRFFREGDEIFFTAKVSNLTDIDDESKQTVIRNVQRVLRPGGLLVVEATDNVATLLGPMQQLSPWLYRQPLNYAQQASP